MIRGPICVNTARMLRYAVTAARADFKRAQDLPEDHREGFLDRMYQHGGYMFGATEQQVYVIVLSRLLGRARASTEQGPEGDHVLPGR